MYWQTSRKVTLIYITSSNIWKCPGVIIFKTFAKLVLIYCFNLHFLDEYEVKHLFICLLPLHYSGMPLCRGIWLEEKPLSGNTFEAAGVVWADPWVRTPNPRASIWDTILQPLPAPRWYLPIRVILSVAARFIPNPRRLKKSFLIFHKERISSYPRPGKQELSQERRWIYK